MPTSLRIMLITGALFALLAVATRIKKGRILMEDAIFWVIAAVVLLLMAIFSDLVMGLAYALGFMSPANFVFLVIIALLLWKVFTNSSETSRLKAKVNELAQEMALAQPADEDGGEDGAGADGAVDPSE